MKSAIRHLRRRFFDLRLRLHPAEGWNRYTPVEAREDEEEIWESSEVEETGHEETGDAQKPARAEATPRATRIPREKLDDWQK